MHKAWVQPSWLGCRRAIKGQWKLTLIYSCVVQPPSRLCMLMRGMFLLGNGNCCYASFYFVNVSYLALLAPLVVVIERDFTRHRPLVYRSHKWSLIWFVHTMDYQSPRPPPPFLPPSHHPILNNRCNWQGKRQLAGVIFERYIWRAHWDLMSNVFVFLVKQDG